MTEPTDPKPDGAEPVLTPGEEAELVEMLVSAYRPAALAAELNEALIEAALEDPFRAPSADERAESERFRRALEGDTDHPDLALARALRAAHHEVPGERETDQASARALEGALGAAGRPRPKNVVFVVFGVATSIAAAAAVLLVLAFPSSKEGAPASQALAAPAAPPLVQSRSAEPLFNAKFERTNTTMRVDRIATLRARELRDNRFRQWGVDTP